ncbi:MAG: 1-deoxy-D-xylulose-5-phosphate synthase, partial [Dehalococcoidia bacterium]
SEIFAQTSLHLMRNNQKVVVITPAMPEANFLSIIQEEFPERVFDVGICEQHAVTFAAGLATQGFIPIVAIYSTFLQRAFDQIIHDVCLQDLKVIFALDRGGIVGDDGKTHQGTFDLSYLSLIPNLIVSASKDENELQHLLYTAVDAAHSMAIRYPRGTGSGVKLDAELSHLKIGKGEILRHGDDVAIFAIGATVEPALEASRELSNQGIEATVVNSRFIKPIDSELITAVAQKTKNFITVEENVLIGGFGSRVASLLQQYGFSNVKLKSIGIIDEFVEHGTQSILREKYNLDTKGIIHQTITMLNETGYIIQPKSKGKTQATLI